MCPLRFCALCLAALVFSGSPAEPRAWADDGFWAAPGGGSWPDPADWDSGTVADGTDNTAYFGFAFEPPLPSGASFTLDGARTIGNLYFTATGGTEFWSLDPGSGGPLVLNATFNPPDITVNYSGQTVAINVVLDGTNGVEMDGPGTLILDAANTYSGDTLVSVAAFVVNGSIGPGNVDVQTGALSGTGSITGPVVIEPGGALSPGPGFGALTISNILTLSSGSKTAVDVDAMTSGHDLVQGVSFVSYGGTLTVSNAEGTPALGQSFQLFNAAAATGDFAGITPQLAAGLRWRFDPGSGVLSVVSSASQPFIQQVAVTNANVVLTAANGTPGATAYVLSSTNLALAADAWARVGTNVFDISGRFAATNALSPVASSRFYRVSAVVNP